jgi:predicted N-acyltransferase
MNKQTVLNRKLNIKIVNDLRNLSARQWNRLVTDSNPFLRHEFLIALERNGCVGEKFGWLPQHVVVMDDANELLAAMPLYAKYNSYGELVFDWSWADALQRTGRPYYPKLVSALPYTPVTSNRLLLGGETNSELRQVLLDGVQQLAEQQNVSSLHVLFPQQDEMEIMQTQGWMPRMGVQFHWFNHGYQNFEEFLAGFRSSKRKKVKQERRRVRDENIQIEIVHGNEATESQWHTMSHYYEKTFEEKGGYATFNLDFFQDISASMGDQVVLVFARYDQRYIAGAICYKSDHCLYGRHWGADRFFDALHFEVCYYAGIEYCIERKLQKFEPGAQGEHKISRGFVPTKTWSNHWLRDDDFRRAIASFLDEETEYMEKYFQALKQHVPYKQTS